MNAPRVSVVMPVFNRGWCVAEAVESVLALPEPALELVVVDDGSTDDTPAVLARCAGREPRRMRVLAHPGRANRGIARSRNLGVAASRGDYLAFLDSDDLYLPNRFAHALPWLDAHPRAAACIEPYATQALGSAGHSPPQRHLTAVAGGGLAWLREMLFATNYWLMPCITLRRGALARFGGFDERLAFAEETALWLRLAATGAVGAAQDERPVAVVRRHDRHSWDPADRVADTRTYLHVLLDAIGWCDRSPRVAPAARALLHEKLRSYLVEILSDPQLPLGARLRGAARAASRHPRVLADRRVLANIAYAPLRRSAARSGGPAASP